MDEGMIPCSGDERHMMMKGKKFCGACGRPPVEEAVEIRKCADCTGDLMKGARFCSDCGVEAPAPDDLDVQLGVLAEFQKSMSAEKLRDLTALPSVEDEEQIAAAASARAAELVKAGKPAGAPEDEDVSAMPILEALLATSQSHQGQSRAHAEHLVRCLTPLLEGMGHLMKAVLAQGARTKALESRVIAYGNQPRDGGPKGAMRVVPARAARPTTGDELRGESLMKAVGDLPEPEGLDLTETTQFAQHVAAGHSIDEIAQHPGREGLAAKLRGIVGRKAS